MSYHYSSKSRVVKARIKHHCWFCKQRIEAGTEYFKSIWMNDGHWFSSDAHLPCQEAAEWTFKHDDEWCDVDRAEVVNALAAVKRLEEAKIYLTHERYLPLITEMERELADELRSIRAE